MLDPEHGRQPMVTLADRATRAALDFALNFDLRLRQLIAGRRH
ncbi:hypothetical protein [Nocardia sp.]|nr:hypothetical protein [Nocardia sp.]